MVKELTDISAFNHTQKKSFHIIIITIAIVTMTIFIILKIGVLE